MLDNDELFEINSKGSKTSYEKSKTFLKKFSNNSTSY